MTVVVKRVSVTPAASKLIAQLKKTYGRLMFHQSGGCCDGSSPMCYPRGEFRVGQSDLYLGDIEDCPFFIGRDQFEHWQHTHLIIDAVSGRGSGFSLEASSGYRFLTRSRIYTPKETEALQKLPPPITGAEMDKTNV